jgi:hypothetical protein
MEQASHNDEFIPTECILHFHFCCEQRIMSSILESKDNRAFGIDCSANPVGRFQAGADSLSVKIGQRISRFGAEEIWDSVIIHGNANGDELTVRVLVCHPAWDEPQEIACIRSNSRAENPPDNSKALNCTLVMT